MKIISDISLLSSYIDKHDLRSIFDEDILKYARLQFYQKEEIILTAEVKLEYYYLLVDGKIKVSYLFENGKSMFLKFYEELITIGDLELLKNIPVLCNVEAVSDTFMIAISADILRKDYLDNVKFLHHLINSLSEKFYETINNISYNYVYPLTNRLASYLVGHITDKNYITLDSSYEEIAEFLGTTYRHLNRTIKELERKSVIKCKNKMIYILDEEMLRELSKNLYIKSI